MLGSVDQFLTHKLQVVDMQGNVLLALTRPAKVMKSKVIVQDAPGRRDRPDRAAEHDRQDPLRPRGRRPHLRLDQRRELAGVELPRRRTTPAPRSPGSPRPGRASAKTLFTTADNFVVQIHRPLEEPLRTLVVASSLAVDTALKQDDRGVRLTAPWQPAGSATDRARCATRSRAALAEDLTPLGDLTSALLPEGATCVADFVPAPRRGAGRHARARPRPSPSSTPSVEVAWAAGDGDAVAAGPVDRHRVRADGVGAHRRADGAELPVPPVRDRHDHAAVRRRGRLGRVGPDLGHPQDHARAAHAAEGGRAGRGGGEPPRQPVRLGDVQGQPPRGARHRRGGGVGQGHLAGPARARRGDRPRRSSPRRSRPAPTPCCSTT